MEDSKVAMLLENLESQLSAIAEGVIMVNEKLDAHIEENRRDFKIIFERLDENSIEHRQNKQEHQLMMQMIKELSEKQDRFKRAK
mgnify:CR=1 FL=1